MALHAHSWMTRAVKLRCQVKSPSLAAIATAARELPLSRTSAALASVHSVTTDLTVWPLAATTHGCICVYTCSCTRVLAASARGRRAAAGVCCMVDHRPSTVPLACAAVRTAPGRPWLWARHWPQATDTPSTSGGRQGARDGPRGPAPAPWRVCDASAIPDGSAGVGHAALLGPKPPFRIRLAPL